MESPYGVAESRRSYVTALALVAFPLAGLAGSLILPQYTDGMRGELAFIDAHRTRWLVGMAFDLLFSLLLIPAAVGLVRTMRGRSTLGVVSGAMLAVAAFVHGAMLGFQLSEASLVAHMTDRAQAIAVTEAMSGDPGFVMLVLPFTVLLFPGLLLAAFALWRSRVAPLAAALAIAAAVPVEILGPWPFKASIMFALLLAGFGWVGVRLLRGSVMPAATSHPTTGEQQQAGALLGAG